MKISLSLLFAVLLFAPAFGQKQKPTTMEATTTEGKTVILKSDGTWEYAKSTVVKQAQCDLTLKDAPALRRLRVGMSKAEIANAFAVKSVADIEGLPPKIQDDGVLTYTYYNSTLEKFDNFHVVDFLELSLYGNFLYKISIRYSPSYGSPSKEKLSEMLKISSDLWQPVYLIEGGQMGDSLKCKEFTIEISLGKTFITDLTIEEQIKVREAEKQRNFKP